MHLIARECLSVGAQLNVNRAACGPAGFDGMAAVQSYPPVKQHPLTKPTYASLDEPVDSRRTFMACEWLELAGSRRTA
jgi:hypothetical protein